MRPTLVSLGGGAPVRYAVIVEGSDTRAITEYDSRATAVLAIEREVDRLQAAGAIIEGDLSSGYLARWHEQGQRVSLRLTLAPVPVP